MARIEVGIVLRVVPGAPPVVIGAIADDELLRHALRVAIDTAVRRDVEAMDPLDLVTNGPKRLM